MKKWQKPPRWLLNREAEKELEEIGVYTEAMWGREQRDRYLDLIEECFNLLTKNPQRGKDFGHIRAGYRRRNVGEHCIFYRVASNGIIITRVLHQKRDILRHILEDYPDR